MIFMLMLMLLIILLISFIMVLINLIFSMKNKMTYEKSISFECGFDLFSSSRLPFSIHFYLIGILFLVFDIEIVLLFPMIGSLKILNYFNWLYISFLILWVLYVGLEFEKKEGVLSWIV
uniref:NADH-ubiquinone oxidoreductase chain 3 n=1 Tax=Ichneutes sp. QL-2013 TaxID=1421596 RepID=A0A0A6ZL70_9HYME|nr:NADH dehydrogenase subunit 3 [Ichneutes sp. QL-2013]